MTTPRLQAGAVALCAVVLSDTAWALEQQHELGVGLGGAALSVQSDVTLGPSFGAHYVYGLTDSLNLLAETGASFGVRGRSGVSALGHAGVGLGYVLDVLRWVPYFGLLGTGYLVTVDSQWVAGAAVALGLDYKVSRTFTVGFAARQHLLLTQMSTYPTYTTAHLRAEVVWGW